MKKEHDKIYESDDLMNQISLLKNKGIFAITVTIMDLE